MRSFVPVLLLALALPSCRPAGDRADSSEALSEAGAFGAAPRPGGDPVAKGAENVVLPPVENITDAPPPEAGGPNMIESSLPASDLPIPSQYQGRWGMVPADCEPGRSDAKGLVTINGRTMRFYESLGTLAEVRPAIATSFSGLFRYTGEGMSWTRVETLTRSGDRLTRATDEGTFRYTRCPA